MFIRSPSVNGRAHSIRNEIGGEHTEIAATSTTAWWNFAYLQLLFSKNSWIVGGAHAGQRWNERSRICLGLNFLSKCGSTLAYLNFSFY